MDAFDQHAASPGSPPMIGRDLQLERGGRDVRKVFTRYDFTSRPPSCPPLGNGNHNDQQQLVVPWDEQVHNTSFSYIMDVTCDDHDTTLTALNLDENNCAGFFRARVVSTDDQLPDGGVPCETAGGTDGESTTIVTTSTARQGDVDMHGAPCEDSEDLTLPLNCNEDQQQQQERRSHGNRMTSTRRQPFTSPKRNGQGIAAEGSNNLNLRQDVRVVLANNKVFFHSSAILQYASPILSRHLVWKHRNLYELDLKHRPALEWQWLLPFLQPHSQVSVAVTPLRVVHLLPWFLELELDVLIRECDRVLYSSLVGTVNTAATLSLTTTQQRSRCSQFSTKCNWKCKCARDINDLLILSKIVLESQRRRSPDTSGAEGQEDTGTGSEEQQKGRSTWIMPLTGEAVLYQWNHIWNNSPHLFLSHDDKDGSLDNRDPNSALRGNEDPLNATATATATGASILCGLEMLRSFVTDVFAELPDLERQRLWLSMIRYLPPDLDVFSGDASCQHELLDNPLFPYLLREGLAKHQLQEQQRQTRTKEERGFVLVGDPHDITRAGAYDQDDNALECGQEVLLDPRHKRLDAVQTPLLYQDWQESFQEWWNYWSSGSGNNTMKNLRTQTISKEEKGVSKNPCPDLLCPTNQTNNSIGSVHRGSHFVAAAQGFGDLLVATVTARPLLLQQPAQELPSNRSEWLENVLQHLQHRILPALPNHKDMTNRDASSPLPLPSSPCRPKLPTRSSTSRSKSPSYARSKENVYSQRPSSSRSNKNDSYSTYVSSALSSLVYSEGSSYCSAVASKDEGLLSRSRRGRQVLRQYAHRRSRDRSSVIEGETASTSEFDEVDETSFTDTTNNNSAASTTAGLIYDPSYMDATNNNSSSSSMAGLIYDPGEGVLVAPHASQRKFYC